MIEALLEGGGPARRVPGSQPLVSFLVVLVERNRWRFLVYLVVESSTAIYFSEKDTYACNISQRPNFPCCFDDRHGPHEVSPDANGKLSLAASVGVCRGLPLE